MVGTLRFAHPTLAGLDSARHAKVVMLIRHTVELIAMRGALAAALLSLSMTPTLSADYRIDYAIKTDIGEEVGVVDFCEFDRLCSFDAKDLGYHLSVEIFTQNTKLAYLHMRKGADCCFFSSAEWALSFQIQEALVGIPFFKGAPARRNLFLQNKENGLLYLHISLLSN